MEQLQKVIEKLNYPMISLDSEEEQEEYILTEDEERSALAYAIRLYAVNAKGVTLEQKIERAKEYYDEERIKELFARVNSNKHQELWKKEQSEKRKQFEKEYQENLLKRCNASYFFKLFKHNANRDLIINDCTLPYIKTICYFFGNDERFETELGYSFFKGLWIRGAVGLGKSFILSCIQSNEIMPFKIHSVIDIANQVAECGSYEIIEPLKVIDDVGSEQNVVNHYGTKINWFKDFIELYYAQQKPFNYLIVTTNFDFTEIEKNYGFRVRSRIKDMFNIVDVKGDDLRGK